MSVRDAFSKRRRTRFDEQSAGAHDSVEHSGDGATVTGGQLDDARGIPEADRAAVFEHSHTTDEDGTCFGLAFVGTVVSAHSWTVSVTDSETGRARFEADTSGGPAGESEPVELKNET
jgi:nitrogen-specific signal transduction histidine kinase